MDMGIYTVNYRKHFLEKMDWDCSYDIDDAVCDMLR